MRATGEHAGQHGNIHPATASGAGAVAVIDAEGTTRAGLRGGCEVIEQPARAVAAQGKSIVPGRIQTDNLTEDVRHSLAVGGTEIAPVGLHGLERFLASPHAETRALLVIHEHDHPTIIADAIQSPGDLE